MDRGEVTSLILHWFNLLPSILLIIHPSSSSSTLVWSSWVQISWLVFILSHLTFSSKSPSKIPLHLSQISFLRWCTSRFRPWHRLLFSGFIQLRLQKALSSQRTQSSTHLYAWCIPNCTFSFTPSELQLLHLKCSLQYFLNDILSWMNSNKLLFQSIHKLTVLTHLVQNNN